MADDSCAFPQLELACDFMHWSLQQKLASNIFTFDEDTAWRFLRFSKHSQPHLRALEKDPSLLRSVMSRVLNPFATILELVREARAHPFYTILPLKFVAAPDWKQLFLERLASNGFEVVFLYCAHENTIARLLFAVRRPSPFDPRDLSRPLSGEFRWKADQRFNPFIPLLPVADPPFLALAMAHVAFYRVAHGVANFSGQALDTVDILRVEGLSAARVRLALSFVTNLPFQRQARGLLVQDERAAALGKRLEDSGFKVSLAPSPADLAWGPSRQLMTAASLLFHVRDKYVADRMRSCLTDVGRLVKGAFFLMRGSVVDGVYGHQLHVLVLFGQPMHVYGEDGVTSWALAMSKELRMCTFIGLVPVDLPADPTGNPLVSVLAAGFCEGDGPGLEQRKMASLLPELRNSAHTAEMLARQIHPLRFRSPPTTVQAVARSMQAPSRAPHVLPAQSRTIQVPAPVPASSQTLQVPAPSRTIQVPTDPRLVPVDERVTVQKPVLDKSWAPAAPAEEPSSPSEEDDEPLQELGDARAELLAACPALAQRAQELLACPYPHWLTWHIEEPYNTRPPVCAKTFGHSMLMLYKLMRDGLMPVADNLEDAGKTLAGLVDGTERDPDDVYFPLCDAASAIKGLRPVLLALARASPKAPEPGPSELPAPEEEERRKTQPKRRASWLDDALQTKRPRTEDEALLLDAPCSNPLKQTARHMLVAHALLWELMPDVEQLGEEFWLKIDYDKVVETLDRMQDYILDARDAIRLIAIPPPGAVEFA